MRYALTILVQGFCPLKLKLLNLLMTSVLKCWALIIKKCLVYSRSALSCSNYDNTYHIWGNTIVMFFHPQCWFPYYPFANKCNNHSITIKWKMADCFISQRYSLKNKLGDRMMKQYWSWSLQNIMICQCLADQLFYLPKPLALANN